MTFISRLKTRFEGKKLISDRTKKVLKLATSIVEKIPSKKDSTAQTIVKLMSIADDIDSARTVKKPTLAEVLKPYGVVPKTSALFVSMFHETKLNEDFVMGHQVVEGHSFYEAISKEHGTLIFTRNWDNKPEPTFYHSADFDFARVLQRTWDNYNGRIHFEIRWNKSVYSTFSAVANPLYGTDESRMNEMVARHRRFQVDQRTRAYMFHGEPGTGKTSFAIAFADKVGGRILRVDAQSFAMVSVSDIIFLIDALSPDFILIDDVDKADVGMSLPTILGILQEIKQHDGKTSLLLTANIITNFDKGFLRPGRVDTWVSFDPPNPTQRRDIIKGYVNAEKVKVDDSLLEELVVTTEGLTQDYLRETAQCLKYDDPSDIIANIKLMQNYLGKAKPKPKPKDEKADDEKK